MAGQVPEAVRRARAAELLGLAAALRREWVERAVGTERLVLFEAPDGAGGWVGHAEDMVPVRAAAVGGASLEGEIGRVLVDGQDPDDPEWALGRVLALVPRPVAASGVAG
jgi:tRNA A37 methylthiotransferase MiaB